MSIATTSAAPRRSISNAQKPSKVPTSRQRLPASDGGRISAAISRRSNQPGRLAPPARARACGTTGGPRPARAALPPSPRRSRGQRSNTSAARPPLWWPRWRRWSSRPRVSRRSSRSTWASGSSCGGCSSTSSSSSASSRPATTRQAFYRGSEAYLYNLTAFAMTRTKLPYLRRAGAPGGAGGAGARLRLRDRLRRAGAARGGVRGRVRRLRQPEHGVPALAAGAARALGADLGRRRARCPAASTPPTPST